MARPPRLLEQVRQRIRAKHCSYRTEKTCLHWIRRFIRFHGRRHLRELGGTEVERLLTALAVDRKVSASSHNQAPSAVLILYREVLETQLPWLDGRTVGTPASATPAAPRGRTRVRPSRRPRRTVPASAS